MEGKKKENENLNIGAKRRGSGNKKMENENF